MPFKLKASARQCRLEVQACRFCYAKLNKEKKPAREYTLKRVKYRLETASTARIGCVRVPDFRSTADKNHIAETVNHKKQKIENYHHRIKLSAEIVKENRNQNTDTQQSHKPEPAGGFSHFL